MKTCIGLLGGSFNPPHRGHLALARTVLDLGLVERVKLIPAAVPPHKKTPREADAETRLAMTRLLAEEDERLSVDDLELRRTGPSFSIDTVRQLEAAHPETCYRLIIGSDMAKAFATWREYRELLSLAPPLIAERPDSVFEGGPGDNYPGLTFEEIQVMQKGRFEMIPVDVSSTKIRNLLAEGAGDGEMLRYLTAGVLGYIRRKGLYDRVT